MLYMAARYCYSISYPYMNVIKLVYIKSKLNNLYNIEMLFS